MWSLPYPGYPAPLGIPPYLGSDQMGCDPFPNGNTVGPVIAPAVPWITKYKLLQTVKPSFRGGPADVDYLLEPDALQRGCRSYWHIECYAREKQFTRADAEAAFGGDQNTVEQISAMNNARPSSQLKILVEWTCARQEKRFFIADIGTGVDLQVGPTVRPRAMLFVPDDAALPTSWPTGFDLSKQVTATTVTARATPIPGGFSPFNGRYTQSLLSPASSSEPIYHEIPAIARDVMLYETDMTDPAAVTGPPSTWSYAFDSVAPGGAPFIPLGIGGAFPSVDAYDIPQNAKFICVQPGNLADGPARLITLVYGLSL